MMKDLKLTGQRVELDGAWRFSPDPHRDGEALGFCKAAHETGRWLEVAVPSCFETAYPDLAFFEGCCWYRRSFSIPEAWHQRRVVLRFEAVNYRAKVWLNDLFLGENLDPFLPFEFEIPETALQRSENLLAVAVDNAHYPGDVPGKHVGWRGFGGIIREVFLYTTDYLHLGGVRVIAAPASGGGGEFEFRIPARNQRPETEAVLAEVQIRDANENLCASVQGELRTLRAGDKTEWVLSGRLESVTPWSPQNPFLYQAQVRLLVSGQSLDSQAILFGFRRIQATPEGLLLNDEPIFLTGFNRHEDSPRTDAAVDHELTRQDLEAMKEAGANLVRLCHYPHAPRELELCDQLGLLVFAEIPLYFWNDPDDGRRHQGERTRTAARQLERMVARDFNHPSIIFWSVSNETQEDEAEVAESNSFLLRFCRQLDPSRLHVHVSCHWTKHPRFEDDDVICLNGYPSGEHSPASYDREGVVTWWRENLGTIRKLYPGKPLLVTEFGYGSFAGTFGHALGEDEQALVLENEFRAFDPALVCGALVWCWADHPWPAGRFLGGIAMSPFGVVNRQRHRLLAFWRTRSLFRKRQGLPENRTADSAQPQC